ncbi:MAG: restriction endonuclease [Pseudomonadota bacterium]|nr:restriction endonuclease [Pseudomonadota bacterium]
MARKRKSSAAKDFIGLIALVPWWIGLTIGVISYLVLHGIATAPVVVVPSVQGLAGSLYGTFAQALAQAGQYLVPLMCLIGAGVSALGRQKRKNLLDGVAKAGNTNALAAMTWLEFEQMTGEWFRRQGYAITEVGGAGPDGGIDLVVHKNGEKFLVQCKQWRAVKVGVGVVRELYGVMAAERVAGGFVVTSGSFTEDAKKFAQGRNVELLDGAMLIHVLRAASPELQQTGLKPPPKAAEEIHEPTMSRCHVCGSDMVRRVAKRGANAGQAFLGCSGYPACKTTRPVS